MRRRSRCFISCALAGCAQHEALSGPNYPIEVDEMLVGGLAKGVESIIMRQFLWQSKYTHGRSA